MKRRIQFAVFVASALFGLVGRASDGVPPENQPRPAGCPQKADDERPSRYAPTEQQIIINVRMIEIQPAVMKAIVRSSGKMPHVIHADHDLLAQLDDLREKGAVKVLADPAVVTVSGRPVYFNSGDVEFGPYGTQLDAVARSLGNDKLHLDFKVQNSQPVGSSTVDDGKLKLPALRVRKCETSVECQSGQTLIIVGLPQKSEPPTTSKSADNAADEPALAKENSQEPELLVLVRATFDKDSDAAKASSAAHGGGSVGRLRNRRRWLMLEPTRCPATPVVARV
jgi:hypothetical protein